jgi:hypothetical protein
MRVLRTITTPWAPYSMMFSRDGTRLAIGGGSWYGNGGILLVSLGSGEMQMFPCADLPGELDKWGPTVSGVCFSADDGHLAASTWAGRHNHSPTFLFEVSGIRLRHLETLVHRYQDKFGHSCPTGVLLSDGYTIIRNNTSILGDVFVAWPSARHPNVHTDRIPHHLTSSQMVLIRGNLFTGGGGSLALRQWRRDLGFGEIGKAAAGLVTVPLEAELPSPEVIPVQQCRRVTAIGARPGGDGFVTGGLDGELDTWSWNGRWEQNRLRPATHRPQPRFPDITWATYTPNSIVGICSLSDGDRWVSVSADGEVCVWNQATLACCWQLPEKGTPRSLAAHPHGPWVAVGVKKGGFPGPRSAVVLVEVEPLPVHTRTPTVLGLEDAPGRPQLLSWAGQPKNIALQDRFRELLSRLDAACAEGQHQAFLELLDQAYVRVPASERDAFRALFGADHELNHQICGQLSRVAEQAAKAGEVEASLRARLLWVSLGDHADGRDVLTYLADTWLWAERKGLDPAPSFQDIGEVSSTEITHVSGGSTQRMIRRVAEDPACRAGIRSGPRQPAAQPLPANGARLADARRELTQVLGIAVFLILGAVMGVYYLWRIAEWVHQAGW